MITKLIKWSGVSGFDKFLGVIFGMTRGLIVIFIIFLLMPNGLKNSQLMTNSKISPFIEEIAPKIEAYIRELIDNDAIIKPELPEILDSEDLITNTQEEA
jgi:membrane protein required for colicin V production